MRSGCTCRCHAGRNRLRARQKRKARYHETGRFGHDVIGEARPSGFSAGPVWPAVAVVTGSPALGWLRREGRQEHRDRFPTGDFVSVSAVAGRQERFPEPWTCLPPFAGSDGTHPFCFLTATKFPRNGERGKRGPEGGLFCLPVPDNLCRMKPVSPAVVSAEKVRLRIETVTERGEWLSFDRCRALPAGGARCRKRSEERWSVSLSCGLKRNGRIGRGTGYRIL